MAGPGQIPIRFPEARLSFAEMEKTSSNRAAIAAVRRVEHWPYHVFCLIGPRQSGLTTIAQAWAEERDGTCLLPTELNMLMSQQLEAYAAGSLAVDRADEFADGMQLLTMISAAERLGGHILLTANTAPSQWPASTRDLASRLRSAPIVELGNPDEALMRARIRRACDRAYLKLPKPVEDYLVIRLGLSFALIEDAILQLDGAAGGRPLSVPMAREVLAGEDWDG